MARLSSIAFVLSVAAHAVAYASLDSRGARAAKALAESVEFELAARQPEPVEPDPPPPPPPPPKAVEVPPPSPRAPAPEPTNLEPEPPPLETQELSGETLTSASSDSSFAMPSGDGTPRIAPLRAIAPARPPVAKPAPAPKPALTRSEPQVVPSKSLAEKPSPPALDAELRRVYPANARRQGVSGRASLRILIAQDGRVRRATLLDESYPGFGDACQRALLGSRWSAPLDAAGHRVATEVRYTCRFEVE
jgi:periplasmic protein TonB